MSSIIYSHSTSSQSIYGTRFAFGDMTDILLMFFQPFKLLCLQAWNSKGMSAVLLLMSHECISKNRVQATEAVSGVYFFHTRGVVERRL